MATTLTERKPGSAIRTNSPAPPQIGDRYGCRICGMEIEIIADCGCKDARKVHLECCGQRLVRT